MLIYYRNLTRKALLCKSAVTNQAPETVAQTSYTGYTNMKSFECRINFNGFVPVNATALVEYYRLHRAE